MFLHIGGDISVPVKDIIFILDLKSAGSGVATKEFLEISQDEGLVTEVGPGESKSLILTTEGAYLSAISSLTLGGRSKTLQQNLGIVSSATARD